MSVRGGIFVTGTDTGVGKTVFSAALARLLRKRGINVGVMKPVTTGCILRDGVLISEDAELLAFGAGTVPDSDCSPYNYKAPIAPSAAAELEQGKIEFSRILAAFHKLAEEHDYVIVEGAGGLMVPLAGGLLIADLIKLLALPVLIVARPDLGTVNHTLLTSFTAKQLGLDVRGTVISGYPESPGMAELTAPHLIDSLAGVPLLARIPSFPADNDRARVDMIADWLAREPATRLLLREIGFE